jgi:hypothetical protein
MLYGQFGQSRTAKPKIALYFAPYVTLLAFMCVHDHRNSASGFSVAVLVSD